ncbi:acyl-CoA thioesterase domain-containing protein [Cryptosporangium aurantiacum]|uniref:Acyl-CoA thioesterase n=1 Tax=Cryptosporangium aurantiacum TaxID=134849 RepID=A0A1M7R4H6_9ACTN|nr:acyl-CoA thioesterase domain-containing protein [Cryptosporangium aurantiacum]SHN40123.1 Acyl-CoA thioesterase [Cryptosporangium aurantiacum]
MTFHGIGERLPTLVPDGPAHLGTVPPFWAFAGRAFGGFSSAAALTGAAAFAPSGSVALAARISFVSPTLVGPFRIEATDVRLGRSSSAVNVRLTQDGQTRVTLASWFVRPDLLPAPEPTPPPRADPSACPGTWRDTKNAFDSAFERRTIHFPATSDAFALHGPRVELWIRRSGGPPPDAVSRQADDLMLFDAHLAETVIEGLHADRTRSFSIDLSVTWAGGPWIRSATPEGADDGGDAWRRLTTVGSAAGRIGTSGGTLTDVSGSTIATATQLVAVGPPRSDEGGRKR